MGVEIVEPGPYPICDTSARKLFKKHSPLLRRPAAARNRQNVWINFVNNGRRHAQLVCGHGHGFGLKVVAVLWHHWHHKVLFGG